MYLFIMNRPEYLPDNEPEEYETAEEAFENYEISDDRWAFEVRKS